MLGKTGLVLFDQFNNSGAIDMKINGWFLDEKSFSQDAGTAFLFC